MRVGILMCDHVADRNRDVAGDYDDMFGALLSVDARIEVEVHDAVAGALPPTVDACDAWLVTGSSAGVNDGLPWVDALADFLGRAVEAEVPVVGVCFGHQLLAQVLGAPVARSERGWGVGVHDTRLVAREPWMVGAGDGYRVLNLHQDQVGTLPPGATLLAESDHCPIAMFRRGETVLAIQGHPEFSPEYVRRLVEERRERIGDERADRALASLATAPDPAMLATWITAFLERALAVRSAASSGPSPVVPADATPVTSAGASPDGAR